MAYRFVNERQDYVDYAGGRVFYSLPGRPAFPVRLASEIFQRCAAVQKAIGRTAPYVLYDPCCGGAYHLSTLAYLHWNAIDEIIGSDVDEQVLLLAERNLALLTIDGMDRRIAEITQMLAAYGKASHAAALESAARLREQLLELTKTHPIRTSLFHADATDGKELHSKLNGRAIDIVITDIPYGRRSSWRTRDAAPASDLNPVWQMLDALLSVVSSTGVIAIAADKQQKISHERYQRIERFQAGKRQVVLLNRVC